ncbi:hypothetical protein NEIPOLOT_01473 [Neisseria polysaccharea ATCC 43768]|nr:hypothetical protein NEIPOLOT_01473 [Neisseria polysaccharea ATCC 43768]
MDRRNGRLYANRVDMVRCSVKSAVCRTCVFRFLEIKRES